MDMKRAYYYIFVNAYLKIKDQDEANQLYQEWSNSIERVMQASFLWQENNQTFKQKKNQKVSNMHTNWTIFPLTETSN